ncbi:MAG: M15 family metallopeptidase [Campylobacterales bacterium]|nr:M15 family metallopeptidase [Campylobacterales bacterium]
MKKIFLLLSSSIAIFANDIHLLSYKQKEEMQGVSYHKGCPIGIDELRVVKIKYLGFDSKDHMGELVVHESVAQEVAQIFQELYTVNYPINKMEPIRVYGGSDWRSIEADNSSAFNCRNATGSRHFSKHAYGLAIDLNPIENPYVFANGKSSHKASVPYLDRSTIATTPQGRAVLKNESKAVAIFKKYGWKWGGDFAKEKDYQHFYK